MEKKKQEMRRKPVQTVKVKKERRDGEQEGHGARGSP
jgi:hypothetical protein